MDTTADEIVSRIERTRQDLSSNINELENKVKAATDWREHYQSHPMMMVGIAFGTGALLARMTLGGRRQYPNQKGQLKSETRSHISGGTSEIWGATKMAFAGLIATRLKDVVNEVIPGFREHFDSAQNSRSRNNR